jgi:hypothetical protein
VKRSAVFGREEPRWTLPPGDADDPGAVTPFPPPNAVTLPRFVPTYGRTRPAPSTPSSKAAFVCDRPAVHGVCLSAFRVDRGRDAGVAGVRAGQLRQGVARFGTALGFAFCVYAIAIQATLIAGPSTMESEREASPDP